MYMYLVDQYYIKTKLKKNNWQDPYSIQVIVDLIDVPCTQLTVLNLN